MNFSQNKSAEIAVQMVILDEGKWALLCELIRRKQGRGHENFIKRYKIVGSDLIVSMACKRYADNRSIAEKRCHEY